MIASARAAHVARTARRLGVDTGDVSVDLEAIVARKEALVAGWRQDVEVAGERHRADLVVLNTRPSPRGSSPRS